MATSLDAILLRKLRAYFNLTQRDVAEHTGLHVNTVNAIERGKNFSPTFANKFATLYQCAPKQLLTDEDQPPKNWALVEELQ
jgi:transcriptional regulator with XRE-family HTH domain